MAKREKPKWTVLVYLAGDNNLTTNCISVLQQLENVKYADKDICVLACFDSNTPAPKGARYLAINCKRHKTDTGFDWEIHNDLVSPAARGPAHTIKTLDFCNPNLHDNDRSPVSTRSEVSEGLKRFIKWAVENHKDSERYMLILFGHGPVVAGQTFLAKENPPSSLRLEDLQKVLNPYFGKNRKRKIDILACQNCVMNGIETAWELKDHVNFMIGSEGLVLASGWPYEKMISAIVEDPDAATQKIARKLLKACARNMLDFVVMDRSSEQSLCDLRCLRNSNSMSNAIKGLVNALRRGLAFDPINDDVVLRYPSICNAVRLARLEAQSYWGETFVDLYDFCERLIKSCKEIDDIKNSLIEGMRVKETALPEKLKNLAEQIKRIVGCCIQVQAEIKKMVPESFYIGSELQYSHGLSIYFPWTLPGAPYFFTRRGKKGTEFSLKTAFETYREYSFVECSGWAMFLKAFFQATLRNVRRAPREFSIQSNGNQNLVLKENFARLAEVLTIDLQKSSSDTGKLDPEIWSNVKNYPRRNYLSPADCPRKIDTAGRQTSDTFKTDTSPPVSYLGWNIAGLVAEAILRQPTGGESGGSGAILTSVAVPATNEQCNGDLATSAKRKGSLIAGKSPKRNGGPAVNGNAKRNGTAVVVRKAKQNTVRAANR